jgi:hypothetical protein
MSDQEDTSTAADALGILETDTPTGHPFIFMRGSMMIFARGYDEYRRTHRHEDSTDDSAAESEPASKSSPRIAA